MNETWIIHREPGARAALLRLLRDGTGLRSGSPADPELLRAEAPPVVVLGLVGDLEDELEFVAAHSERGERTRFVMVLDPTIARERARRLFEGVPATFLGWPPEPRVLARVAGRAEASEPASLPERLVRRRLARRAERYLQDLELADLERARELGADRVLVRGEPGTGRELVAAQLHEAAGPGTPLLRIACDARTTLAALAARAADAARAGELWVCLLDVQQLDRTVQRELAGLIELGGGPAGLGIRWLATAGPAGRCLEPRDRDALEPALERELGRIVVELPPLRERTTLIEPVIVVTTAEWAQRHHCRAPSFSADALAAMIEYPWPGNLRELESVVLGALARGGRDPLEATDLALGSTVAPARHTSNDRTGAGPLSDAEDVLATLGDDDPLDETPDPEVETIYIDEAPSEMARARAVAGGEARRRDIAHDEPDPTRLAPLPRAADDDDDPPTGSDDPVGDATAAEPLVPRLARALAHEIRNPLVAVRTFAQLLPERYDDPEFREQFREQVEGEVLRLEALVERLGQFGARSAPRFEPVDVTGLLEELLERARPEIQARRLLVLQELDTMRPFARADADLLRFALEILLERALAWVPERADLFVASKFHPVGPAPGPGAEPVLAGSVGGGSALAPAGFGGPTVRVVLRFYSPTRPVPRQALRTAGASDDVSARETSLDVVLAEQMIAVQGGRLRIEATDGDETMIVVDLPAHV